MNIKHQVIKSGKASLTVIPARPAPAGAQPDTALIDRDERADHPDPSDE